MGRITFAILMITLGGCSLTNELRCRSLQERGEVQGTIQSCMQCVQQFGAGNPEMVNGCALGLDAAALMAPRP